MNSGNVSPLSLEVHDQGCTPVKPCRACLAVKFLEEKLRPNDVKKFLIILSGQPEPSKPVAPKLETPLPLGTSLSELSLAKEFVVKMRRSKVTNIGALLDALRDSNVIGEGHAYEGGRSILGESYGERAMSHVFQELERVGRPFQS